MKCRICGDEVTTHKLILIWIMDNEEAQKYTFCSIDCLVLDCLHNLARNPHFATKLDKSWKDLIMNLRQEIIKVGLD